MEVFFKDYQITVYDKEILRDKKARPVYIGVYNKNQIYLINCDNHYNVIKYIKSFLNVDYYCEFCKHGYKNIGDHNCKATCDLCKRQTCLLEINNQDDISCLFCNKKCKSETCRVRHEEIICLSKKLCKKCKQVKRGYHVCGQNSKWCSNCKLSVENDHKCFIKNDKIDQSSNKIRCLGKFY